MAATNLFVNSIRSEHLSLPSGFPLTTPRGDALKELKLVRTFDGVSVRACVQLYVYLLSFNSYLISTLRKNADKLFISVSSVCSEGKSSTAGGSNVEKDESCGKGFVITRRSGSRRDSLRLKHCRDR